MEIFLEENQEERERLAKRKARREQMLREKRRQEARRRKAKKLIILGTKILGLGILVGGSILLVSHGIKGKQKDTELAVSQVQQMGEQVALKEEEKNLVPETLQQEQAAVETLAKPLDKITFEEASNKKVMDSEEILSEYGILIDEKNNRIVASKGEKTRISPASMTKVLTLLVAAENITEEQLEDKVTMTLEITDYGFIHDCSSVGFLEGEQVTVRDLFYGTILQSGADAALGLATYVSGSHEAFVELMNEKLKELGLKESSNVTNCVGIYDKEHYSTVYDIAVIMKAAISNDFCKKVLSRHTYTTEFTKEHPEGITISNWFLRRIEDKDTGGLVLCAKTGFVNESGNCAVSYGTFQDGSPYICVTAGAHSSWRCIYDHVEIYNQYIKI